MIDDPILIIESAPDLGRALARILCARGFPCRHSLTAQEAIDLMKAIRFRMAFLDVKLPDMKCAELARRLKSIDPKLSIVAVSENLPEGDDITLDGAPFDACILKPYLHQAIHDALDTCL